jgi:hypothetical protein
MPGRQRTIVIRRCRLELSIQNQQKAKAAKSHCANSHAWNVPTTGEHVSKRAAPPEVRYRHMFAEGREAGHAPSRAPAHGQRSRHGTRAIGMSIVGSFGHD